MRPVAVVAVGGNALTPPGERGTSAQVEARAADVGRCLADLVRAGWAVVVVHGNGPQVGDLALQQDAAAGGAPDEGQDLGPDDRDGVPVQPLHVLCAMTQGQLGSALVRVVDAHCGDGSAVALVTHVVVDPADPAFALPTKPIGPFLSAGRAAALTRERGWDVAEDAGRGYRRVVASPRPGGLLELQAVRTLLAVGHVVVAGGGGGVAVTRGPDGLVGVDAVIDKDWTASGLATALGARELYLLTGVDGVLLDAGTAQERPAPRLGLAEARRHLEDGQFPAGSMGPKVSAAVQFLEAGGSRAVITSAARLAQVAAGVPGVGTVLVAEGAPVVPAQRA